MDVISQTGYMRKGPFMVHGERRNLMGKRQDRKPMSIMKKMAIALFEMCIRDSLCTAGLLVKRYRRRSTKHPVK